MKKHAAITFILISVTLDSMGIGLIMPVMPNLIQEVEGQRNPGRADRRGTADHRG